MNLTEKIALFQRINSDELLKYELFYETLEKCNALKINYADYSTTHPIDCDTELLRLQTADYDLCCVLLTMLLREDHFNNGSFDRRQRLGQVKPIVERIINILSSLDTPSIKCFSEKTLMALKGYYVYALVDPRNNSVFYIGKGCENRVFSHEIESGKSPKSEKAKLKRIREIEKDGFSVKRLIINWGLSEAEAFVAETSLINLMNYISDAQLTNAVSGHHVHKCLTSEELELLYGAIPLKKEDIKHSILVIKINKLYRQGMSSEELYDAVRGYWKASLKSIETKMVEYVFGVYNGLIVAVFKPDEWHYAHENINAPQRDAITPEEFEKLKNRVYFVCRNYKNLDKDGQFYLHKSIVDLKTNQSAQNPITYLMPNEF